MWSGYSWRSLRAETPSREPTGLEMETFGGWCTRRWTWSGSPLNSTSSVSKSAQTRAHDFLALSECLVTLRGVKIVVQVKLVPDAVQALAIGSTLRTVNEAANWVSEVAFDRDVPREYELRKHTYAELK